MSTAGLELTSASATLVRIRAKRGEVRLEHAAFVSFTASYRAQLSGADTVDSAEDPEYERAAEAADGFANQGVPLDNLRLGIPGRDAIIRYVHLPPVPPWRLRLLMDDEVDDVAEKAGEPLCSEYRLLMLPDGLSRADEEELSILVALSKEAPLEAKLLGFQTVWWALVLAVLILFFRNSMIGLNKNMIFFCCELCCF